MNTTERHRPPVTASARQLTIVVACAFGLFVAAFAMPAAAPTVPFPALDFGGEEEEPNCHVILSEEPVAGQTVTATIEHEGAPANDIPVWFNDGFVGRTDQRGQVVGTVPYERQLTIRVELPGDDECAVETGNRIGVALATAVGTTGSAVSLGDRSDSTTSVAGLDTSGETRAQRDSGSQSEPANRTGEYEVHGQIDISVDRHPYPGESTTMRATIDGNPVTDATVAVDGDRVGKTDNNGEITITAPEEGGPTIRVAVQRGEFTSVRNVPVLRLDARIVPSTGLPLPGQSAAVVATLGDRPAEEATVSLDGEPLGETDDDGAVEFHLPADPTATLTISMSDQTTSVDVWGVFVPTILVALVAGVVGLGVPAFGYYLDGPRGFVRGLIVDVTLLALAAGFLLGGPRGLLATVVAIVVLVLVVSFLRSDRNVDVSRSSAETLAGRLEQRIKSEILRLTTRLEGLVDSLKIAAFAARNWIGDVRASPARLLGDVRAWLSGLPGRVAAMLARLVHTPDRLLGWLRAEEDEQAEPSASDDDASSPVESPRERFRRLWRRFAKHVVPQEWPHRTAGEISRRAVDQGLPTEPVEELTATFRDVEYGNQQLSGDHVERARDALDAIRSDVGEEEDS